MHDPRQSYRGEPQQLAAWDVLRARRSPHPPNPLRYKHSIWLGLGVLFAAIALIASIFPARSIESEMRSDTEAARLEGFPDLPPGYATDRQIQDFITEWSGSTPDLPGLTRIVEMSDRVGEYQDDSSVINLGVMGSLFALVFLAAVAFGRALNNLYALGYGASALSPAWGFIAWFLPILSFVLPWRVVTEAFQCAWQRPEVESGAFMWTQVVSGLWGLSFIGLWVLNPVTVTWFVPRGDIDEWINHFEWTERMLLWLPFPVFFTVVMLLIVAVRQHQRYRLLDMAASSARRSR